MTTHTFIASSSTRTDNWTDPTVWSGGVPNDPSAVVVIPTIFVDNSTNIYASHINIQSTPIDIAQLFIANNTLEIGPNDTAGLTIGGTAQLAAGAVVDVGAGVAMSAGAVILQSASEMVEAGALTARSLQNSGLMEVVGTTGSAIDVSGSAVNEAGGSIESEGDGTAFSLTASTFDNLGTLQSNSGTLAITTNAGGLQNLSGGTLSGGVYEAGGDFAIDLRGGGVITTDAANVQLSSLGELNAYNTGTSSFQSLQSTLQTIAAHGSLTLSNTADTWNALTIDGLALVEAGTLTSPQLTTAPGGALGGFGTVAGPVVDDGTLTAGLTGAESLAFGPFNPTSFTLEVTGAVTGTGTAVIEPGFFEFEAEVYDPWILRFDAAASVNVAFSDVHGVLMLPDPSQFTGAIAPVAAGGDQVELPNVALSKMTSYSYVDDDGHGTLTMNFSSGPSISLKFTGDYNKDSFSFTNQQALSSSPPNLVITVGQQGLPLHDNFLGAGVSDILVQNASGQVDVGQLSGNSMVLTPVSSLGSQWKFIGNGDFLGTGVDQIAIENTLGNVGIGAVSGGSIHFNTIATGLAASLKFVETGDFLGDGKSEFLIDNTANGQLQVGQVVNGALTSTTIDTLGSQWKYVGAGEFLGPGPDQVAIENTSGNVGIGTVTSHSVDFTAVGVLSASQHIVGVGDFLGDFGNPNAEFLIDNTATGALDFGAVVNGALTLTQMDILGSQWSIVGVADYRGDGSDQILIENTAGNLGIGEMANSVAGPHLTFATVATGFSEWMFH